MLAPTNTSDAPRRIGVRNAASARSPTARRFRLGNPFQQGRELVASQSRHGVRGAHALREAPSHRGQQSVAGGMAQPIVHRLEAIEVHEEDRHIIAAAGGAGERVGDAIPGRAPDWRAP